MNASTVPTGALRQDDGHAAAWAVLGLAAAFVLLTTPDARLFLAHWRGSYTYSHGPLVALLVPVLVWRERDALGFAARAPLLAASTLLAAAGAAWLVAHAAHVDLAREALLPVLLWLAALAVLGWQSARRLAFPFGVFWSGVAFWDVLVPPLQSLTTTVSLSLVSLLGIPALREGNVITVPAGTFEVEGGCSGISFLVVAVTIAAVHGHLNRLAPARWLGLVLAAVPFALVSNWLRVSSLIVIGERTQMRSTLLTHGHLLYGWCLFAVFLAVFLVVAQRLGGTERPAAAFQGRRAPRAVVARRLALVAVLLGAAPVVGALEDGWAARLALHPLPLPAAAAPWSGPGEADPGWAPGFEGPTARERARYATAAGAVVVDLAYYGVEAGEAKLVGYRSRADGPEGVTVDESGVRSVPGAAGALEVRDFVVHMPAGDAYRVFQWYQVGAATAASASRAKLEEGLRAFRGPAAAAAVSLSTPCATDCSGDREQRLLADFAARMAPALVAAAAGAERGR
jgi:EpsI family protein